MVRTDERTNTLYIDILYPYNFMHRNIKQRSFILLRNYDLIVDFLGLLANHIDVIDY